MITTNWFGAAALAVCLTAGTAQAATYTFDFTEANSGWLNTMTFGAAEDSTVKVTASAGTYTDAKEISTNNSRVATWQGAGLGVCSAVWWSCLDNDHRVDGSGSNDLAIFAFEKAMQVTSISFSYFDSVYVPAKYELRNTTCKNFRNGSCRSWNQEYVLVSDSETIRDMFDLFLGTDYALTDVVGETVSFADLPSVLSFAVGASGKYDAFKITGLTAEHIEPPAPVPLPAGGLLLLTAMGGIAALKRRRKAA